MFKNLDRRPIDFVPFGEREAREPMTRAWYRFRETPCAVDRFADAARSLILIDSFSWPATWPAHPSDGPSPWIAPNLDLHVRFHHDPRPHEWLLCETRADLVVSGVPFSTMERGAGRATLEAAKRVLSERGRFVAYQFRSHVRRFAEPVFGPAETHSGFWNLPPMRIYVWKREPYQP